MLKHKRLGKGIRKFIRHEKVRLRREITDLTEQERGVKKLLDRVGRK
ncbi:MAG: hypothetical protein Q8Q20_03975 [bacterium]|nr:hypothetical protein [bacterium]